MQSYSYSSTHITSKHDGWKKPNVKYKAIELSKNVKDKLVKHRKSLPKVHPRAKTNKKLKVKKLVDMIL